MRLNIKTPKFWRRINIISLVLSPLSLFYYLGFLLHKKFSKVTSFNNITVIGVGNIVAGGAGKTPVVLWLAQELQKKKLNFVVLVKGFGGSLKQPSLVGNQYSSKEVGDEALIYFNHNIPVIASKDKVKGVQLAEKLGFSIVIVDDALQTHKLKKDISILVIDSEYAFGNKLMLPAGPLREPIKNLEQRSDFIINIGNKLLYPNAYKANFDFFSDISGEVIAFSGIANPDKFVKTLDALNLEVKKFYEFPDHYEFTDKEIEQIIKEADVSNLNIVTTEKDWVRLKDEYREKITFVEQFLEVDNHNDLIDSIIRKLK